MRIAIIHHTAVAENEYGYYLSDLLSEYAEWLGYEVELAGDFMLKNKKSLPENAVIGVIVRAKGKFGLQWWYKAKLPAILKKIGAEVVINLNGMPATTVKVPQVLAMPNVSFLENSGKASTPWQKLVLKNIVAHANSASKVITYSGYAITLVETRTGRLKNQTGVVPYSAAKEYKVIEWHEKVAVKGNFADNKEFFIGILDDNKPDLWVTALKAFSKFKKWQQSNMQLLLVPKNEYANPILLDKITTYKYKNDVKVLEALSTAEKASLVASAYSVIHLPANDADILPIFEAMQCGIPFITPESHAAKEFFAGCGILVAGFDHELLGDALIGMYKNEDERSRMIENAKANIVSFNRINIAKTFWELIEGVVKKHG